MQTGTVEVALSVVASGECVVFVKRAARGAEVDLQPPRLAAALAARGLRLVGVSMSNADPPRLGCSRRRSKEEQASVTEAVMALLESS